MIVVVLLVVGLCLGSFVNALVWRLHEQETLAGKKKKPNKRQLEKLSILRGRSMCPDCHHELMPKDLVPLFSWLSLQGKCRYCHKPISWQYPLVEALTALLFVASYIYWPLTLSGVGLFEFIIWLPLLTGLIALMVYDARWFILPSRIIYPLIALVVIQVAVATVFFGGGTAELLGALSGILILAGLFSMFFFVSKGQWIGFGDVRLAILLGLLVGGPLNSILLLFLASSGGTVLALPLLFTGRANRKSHLPFGPFLIVAAIIVVIFGASITSWYKTRFALP